MSTVVEGKDTVKFVTEEEIDNAATVVEEKQEEADSQSAAFNPETGEINWDCPCLGGMAQGPCGEDFKAAFSCFVFSEAEPKGLDCVEKFKAMQDCFRRHPDVYGDEIDDDDEEEEETAKQVEEIKESTQDASIVASSPDEEQSNTLSSWISSWF
ncbi:Oxidoreductase [Rhizopus azygosporus]|uniref:Mitochondrial intermembrane space import and assembly protein 40 n=1 Tax=Rhizopus azygosporus TaxID=86630 RepID=A0A367KFR2_RHIAZ|nr:Oxidoreductase [Rhizopus azygosporus]